MHLELICSYESNSKRWLLTLFGRRPGKTGTKFTAPVLETERVWDIALLGSWPGPVSPAGKPKGSRLYVLTALSKQLQESVLPAFRRRGAGKKEEVQQKEDMLQLPHRLKWENKMACLMKCVCPKFLVVLNWLLVLLCLKAKEEFAETLSAMLQFLLPPSWLLAFAVEGNESRQS